MDNNIDLFNRFTAEIFLRLYESFPTPRALSDSSIAERILGESESWEADAIDAVLHDRVSRRRTPKHSEYASIIRDTIAWLHDCGYVRKMGENPRAGGALYVLSPRSLEVLAAVPASLDKKKISLVDRLRSAANETGKEAGRSALGSTIGEIIGAVARGFFGTH